MRKLSEIKGLEHVNDYYYVTTCGKVLSTYRKKDGEYRVLKQNLIGRGYLKVNLHTANGQKTYLVHRLVGLAFLPNPENKEQINHISECKTENHVRNIEWMTPKENMNYSHAGNKSVLAKPKEFYTTNPVFKSNFKKACQSKGWEYDSFKEVFAELHHKPSGQKEKKFYYILKDTKEQA